MTGQSSDKNAQARRRAAVSSAVASVNAEGLTPSAAFDADAQAYVAGDLSADDLVERAEQRHRKPPATG